MLVRRLLIDLQDELLGSFVADTELSPEYLTILPDGIRTSVTEEASPKRLLDLNHTWEKGIRIHPRSRNEALRTELNTMLDAGEVEQVLDGIASAYLDNPQVFRMLPVRRTVSAISDENAPSVNNILALAKRSTTCT